MKKALFSFLLLFLLFSCGKKSHQEHGNRVINLTVIAPIRSLDPRISNESPCTHIITMLFEGLMCLGPNGEILPGVAESYELSEDQCTYTFHLRDSQWSNGDPVTAYDFEYAWKKSVNPLTAHNGAVTFYVIKNVEACISKQARIDEVGIRALNAKTLQVELEHPAAYFPYLCASSTYSPVHKGLVEKNPQWANTANSDFVCNGPFVIKHWKKSVELYVEKNPLFWNAEVVAIPGIRIQIITDATTQCFLFEKGELDWLGQPFNSIPRDLIAGKEFIEQSNTIDAYGLFWFFLNTEKPPFNNKNFRKAVAYALDREAMAQHVFQLGEEPAMGILNKGISVHDQPYFRDCDIATARKYLNNALEEMGYTLETLPPVKMSQRSCLFTSRVTQAVQEQLRKHLGIAVEIEHADWPVHFVQVQKGDYEMGEMPWHSWLKDPIYMLDTFRSRDLGINMSRWENPEYKELLVLADHEIDPVKRKEYLHQAESFLMEEMPIVPICFTKLFYLSNPRLKGVYLSPLKEIEFRYAYFEAD
ncbi:MAG: peptide ABC transporter substrate-binding protein [Chlamydiia bacterium]|nr:peptide ABC transporter substrate-binding protein [Chlamydiia bacterium]